MKSRVTFWDKRCAIFLAIAVSVIAASFATIALAEDGAAVELLRVEQPRGFGFQLGDQFERHVTLHLRRPYELIVESFPQPGRLNRWMAFLSFDMEKSSTAELNQYQITLRYQVANVEQEITDAGIPSHKLRIGHGDDNRTFLIPAARTMLSPLGSGGSDTLAADIEPQAVSNPNHPAVLYASVCVFAAIVFGYLHFGWFTTTEKSPFRKVYQYTRGIQKGSVSDEEYADVLRRIHDAFNQTAGRTLFSDRLAEFFADYPQFSKISDQVTEYFAHSNAFFFDRDKTSRYSIENLQGFLKQCRDVERSYS